MMGPRRSPQWRSRRREKNRLNARLKNRSRGRPSQGYVCAEAQDDSASTNRNNRVTGR